MPHINVSINDTTGTTVSANGSTTDPEVIAAALVIVTKLTKAASNVPAPTVPAETPAPPSTPAEPLPAQESDPEATTDPPATEPTE